MSYSCKGCGNRFPGCHSHCETYIKEKAEYEERKAQIDREKTIKYGLVAQRSNAVHRAMRKNIKSIPREK